MVGDPASVPAINSLLDELHIVDAVAGRPTPVTVWLECQHDADTSLELRTRASGVVNWMPRKRDGAALVEEVIEALNTSTVAAGEDYFWVACVASSARSIVRHLRKVLGVDKQRIKSLGYRRLA